MTTPMLIGVSGVKRAGKDTTANFFEEFAAATKPAPLASRRRGFADVGKWAFARQFYPDISMKNAIKWVDTWKLDQTAYLTGTTKKVLPGSGFPLYGPVEPGILFRDVLAQFHTEGARDIYGDTFWVDQLLPLDDEGYSSMLSAMIGPSWWAHFGTTPWVHQQKLADVVDVCLITDNRFPNEVERIKELGGFTIKVRRKDAEDEVLAEAERLGRPVHRSELGIPDAEFDYVINNDDNNLDKARERSLFVWQEMRRKHANR
jgi:hypothetical protein